MGPRRRLPLTRFWRCLLVVPLLACACKRDDPTGVAARGAQPGVHLPALQRERLRYLFDAVALVEKTWPRLASDRTCVLLVDKARQWVVNCWQAPPGFERSPGVFRGRPVFTHAGDAFDVGGRTRTTRQLLEQTPAAAHVFAPGAPTGGLPAGRPWLLLGSLEALRAFHPSFVHATTEAWVSVAVHEFVHIHQLRQPGFEDYLRRIDSGELDPAQLSARYAADGMFHAQIEREYAQLVAAARRPPDPQVAARDLRAWVRAYQVRIDRLAALPDAVGLIGDELLFTYLEGVARFVESDFLANPAQHPAAPPRGDASFHDYAAFLGRGYAGSPNRQLDEQYYYAIGYHLCVLLERVDPGWRRRVAKQPGWLIGLVERSVE